MHLEIIAVYRLTPTSKVIYGTSSNRAPDLVLEPFVDFSPDKPGCVRSVKIPDKWMRFDETTHVVEYVGPQPHTILPHAQDTPWDKYKCQPLHSVGIRIVGVSDPLARIDDRIFEWASYLCVDQCRFRSIDVSATKLTAFTAENCYDLVDVTLNESVECVCGSIIVNV